MRITSTRLICLFCGVLAAGAALAALVPVNERPKDRPVVVAVVNSYGPNVSEGYFQNTIQAIARAVAPRPLRVWRMTQDQFLEESKEDNFDISIASSGISVVSNGRYGGTPLLSVISIENPDPNRGNGAALIVRGDDDRIKKIDDLQGKKVAIVSKNAFAGYMIPVVEMYRQGYDLDGMVKEYVMAPRSMQGVFESVKSGKADVGIVTTCLKEAMEREGKIKPGEFKVVLKKPAKNFYCETSSLLYPTWIISAKKTLPPPMARRIVHDLLALKPDENMGTHWTVSTDHELLRRLFTTFKERYPEEKNLWEIMNTYPWIFSGIFSFIVAGIIFSLFLGWLVRKKTREAETAVKERMSADVQGAKYLARIERMEKATAVGTLSSMVAHELKQPLATILNYSEGIKRRLSRGKQIDNKVLQEIVKEIGEQSLRASEIVGIVRNYGKKTGRKVGVYDLSVQVQEIVTLVRSLNKELQISVKAPPGIFIQADQLEIELVLINLLKNASEAMRGISEKFIRIEVLKENGYAEIVIEDNGPKIPDEVFQQLGNFGKSSKVGGLGFGLPIVKELLEPYAGTIEFRRRQVRGVECVVKIPLAPEETKADDGSSSE